MIATTCAAVAGMKASLMMYLNPYDRALAERATQSRYMALTSRARELRVIAPDISVESLEKQTVRLATELENIRLSRYAAATSSADGEAR